MDNPSRCWHSYACFKLIHSDMYLMEAQPPPPIGYLTNVAEQWANIWRTAPPWQGFQNFSLWLDMNMWPCIHHFVTLSTQITSPFLDNLFISPLLEFLDPFSGLPSGTFTFPMKIFNILHPYLILSKWPNKCHLPALHPFTYAFNSTSHPHVLGNFSQFQVKSTST